MRVLAHSLVSREYVDLLFARRDLSHMFSEENTDLLNAVGARVHIDAMMQRLAAAEIS